MFYYPGSILAQLQSGSNSNGEDNFQEFLHTTVFNSCEGRYANNYTLITQRRGPCVGNVGTVRRVEVLIQSRDRAVNNLQRLAAIDVPDVRPGQIEFWFSLLD